MSLRQLRVAWMSREWKVAALGLAVVVAASPLHDAFLSNSLAAATTTSTAPTSTRPQAVAIRRAAASRHLLCLANADLAALDCTRKSAEVILQSLVDWHTQNAQAIGVVEQDEATLQRELSIISRKINRGPADQAQLGKLAELRQRRQAIVEQRKQLRSSLQSAVAQHLTATQVTAWEAAQRNAGLPQEYRYLSDLSEADRATLHKDLRDRARDPQDGDVPLSSVITPERKTALAALQEKITANIDRMHAAEAVVFPRMTATAPTSAATAGQ